MSREISILSAMARHSTTRAIPVPALAPPCRVVVVILLGMTHRVGPKGQVVIPKDLRDELGIEPGDEVTVWRHGDHVALRHAGSGRPLRGRYRGSRLVDELADERTADRAREDAR